MANVIKLKQSSVAGKIPASSTLTQGELAINTTDEKLYTKNSSGNVVELLGTSSGGGGGINFTSAATAPSSPTAGDVWYDSTEDNVYMWVGFKWLHIGGYDEFNIPTTYDGGDSETTTYDSRVTGGDASDPIYNYSINGGDSDI